MEGTKTWIAQEIFHTIRVYTNREIALTRPLNTSMVFVLQLFIYTVSNGNSRARRRKNAGRAGHD